MIAWELSGLQMGVLLLGNFKTQYLIKGKNFKNMKNCIKPLGVPGFFISLKDVEVTCRLGINTVDFEPVGFLYNFINIYFFDYQQFVKQDRSAGPAQLF